jgi:hypothetical protein
VNRFNFSILWKSLLLSQLLLRWPLLRCFANKIFYTFNWQRLPYSYQLSIFQVSWLDLLSYKLHSLRHHYILSLVWYFPRYNLSLNIVLKQVKKKLRVKDTFLMGNYHPIRNWTPVLQLQETLKILSDKPFRIYRLATRW